MNVKAAVRVKKQKRLLEVQIPYQQARDDKTLEASKIESRLSEGYDEI